MPPPTLSILQDTWVDEEAWRDIILQALNSPLNSKLREEAAGGKGEV